MENCFEVWRFSRGDWARLGGRDRLAVKAGNAVLRLASASERLCSLLGRAGAAWAGSPHTCGYRGALRNSRGALGNVCQPHAVSGFCSAGVWVRGSRCLCLETAASGELC